MNGPTLQALNFSPYADPQTDLFMPPPKVFKYEQSPEAEHITWCRDQGISAREIIESVGETWPYKLGPDYGDALLALIRTTRNLEKPASGPAARPRSVVRGKRSPTKTGRARLTKPGHGPFSILQTA